jgi:SulP family sulfate permease
MARVKQDLRLDLERAGFVDKVGKDRIFMTLPTAVDGYLAWSVENLGEPPAGFPPPR